jgi:hypothetical protein
LLQIKGFKFLFFILNYYLIRIWKSTGKRQIQPSPTWKEFI